MRKLAVNDMMVNFNRVHDQVRFILGLSTMIDEEHNDDSDEIEDTEVKGSTLY